MADPPALHLLPCLVQHDGAARVREYFLPAKTDNKVDGCDVWEARFRGRRLVGAHVSVRTAVMRKGDGGWTPEDEHEGFVNWKHDAAPTNDDPVMRALQWKHVADALIDAPVSAEDVEQALAGVPHGV